MATIYYDKDADLSLLKGKTVAIIGYGSQGHAQAQNLRQRRQRRHRPAPRRQERRPARATASKPMSAADAAKQADVINILVPDDCRRPLREGDQAEPQAGNILMCSHGFNIHFGSIEAAQGRRRARCRAKGPGHLVRSEFVAGGGALPAWPSSRRERQDAQKRLAYAKGIGGTRAGVIETTIAEETETDLFGEQAVLCGGASALVKAGFETLVEAGYQPEMAYFECMHELKLIVDLFYQGGLNYMRYSVSNTAEYGDYTRGPRIIAEETAEMMKLLTEVQDGTFAKKWVKENEDGRPWFGPHRASEQDANPRGSRLQAARADAVHPAGECQTRRTGRVENCRLSIPDCRSTKMHGSLPRNFPEICAIPGL